MKYVFYLSLFVLASCRTLHLQDHTYDQPLTQKLLPMDAVFDHRSFAADYPDIYDVPRIILTQELPSPHEVAHEITTELKIKDDTRHLFEHEVIRNISESTGPVYGTIVCSKGFRSKGHKTWTYPTFSILTLGIANLFGMPYAVRKDELEIVVEIENAKREIIGRYAAYGYGEAKVALYKGYTRTDAKRLAHYTAFANALEQIKADIHRDADRINQLLSECGPIPLSDDNW